MSLNQKIMVKSFILIAFTTALLYGFSTQPPIGFAGCFGESSCIACHSSSPLNSGGGTFTIGAQPLDSGVTLFDEGYVPNHPYTLVVTIEQTGQQRWGFEMVARFEGTSQQAGHFTVGPDGFTSLQTSTGLEYIGHTAAGTRPGTSGPVTFVFTWTAPPPEEIPANNPNIVFCGAGNAANGDGTPFGDFIYLASVTVGPNPDVFPTNQEGDLSPHKEQ